VDSTLHLASPGSGWCGHDPKNNTCCDGSPNWSAGGKELLSVSDRGVCTGLGADHPSGGGAPAWVWIGEELLAVQTSDSRCVMLWRGRMVRYVLYSPARDRDMPGQVALREESPRLDVGAARPPRSPTSDSLSYVARRDHTRASATRPTMASQRKRPDGRMSAAGGYRQRVLRNRCRLLPCHFCDMHRRP